jgi:hypothetical protein
MQNDLKALLVRQSLVTTEQIDWAVDATRGSRCTWLEQLLLLGMLDEERVCAAISAQACVPRTDPRKLPHLPIDVIARLPAEVAVEHRVLPIGLEADGDLHIGMVDPLDSTAVEEIQFFAGRPLLRQVVPASALAWALHHFHGVRSALWPRVTRRAQAYAENDARRSAI